MLETISAIQRIIAIYENKRNLVLNLAFCVYLATLNPLITHQLRLIVVREQPNPLWACIIWALIIAEFFAIHIRYPAMRLRIQQSRSVQGMGGTFLILLCIAHLLVNMILVLAALQAMNINLENNKSAFTIVLIFSCFKEVYLLFYLMLLDMKVKPWRAERAGRLSGGLDLVFLIYACLGFSATWELTFGDQVLGMELDTALVLSAILLVVFCLFFLPLRLMALIEEWYVTRGTPAFRRTLLNMLVAYLGLMLPMWIRWFSYGG
jgi:hypothetical protein